MVYGAKHLQLKRVFCGSRGVMTPRHRGFTRQARRFDAGFAAKLPENAHGYCAHPTKSPGRPGLF
jgi:hypothetical protein